MIDTPPGVPGPATIETFRSSPVAWVATLLLLAAAACFVIRLLELDLINEATPDQDDPLTR